MPIVQENIIIPEELYRGILEGTYKRFGGIVRVAKGPHKGEIIQHLKTITTVSPDTLPPRSFAAFVKGHKNPIILAVGAVIGVGVIAWFSTKTARKKKRAAKSFNKALRAYLEALKNKSLNMEVIDELFESIKAIKSLDNWENIKLAIPAEAIDTICTGLAEYTLRLAKSNSIDLETEVKDYKPQGTIIDLEYYLYLQRKMFEQAA